MWKERSNVSVKRDGMINGRQMSVIELPALSRLSEEDVMRETLHGVSLCDPGVHHFILVTPVSPHTNEDRAEMEKIKGIFNSQEHFMVLFFTELTVDKSVSDFVASTESQSVASLYGSWYNVMGLQDQRNSQQISALLDCIESMKTEPYSLQTYIRAPERRVRHELEEKLRVRDNEIKELQQKIKTLVLSLLRSESRDSLGHEGSINRILHSPVNEGHISRPFLKESSDWDSLHRTVVTQSVFKCSVQRKPPLNWDAAYESIQSDEIRKSGNV
ncbi:uncharacterized protein [Sinocyclocheilus grahami]|uniref:uncharacterized protein n=1 Tax=Sinocyclocheilus grahami TaxID=75366 RepID=UPI0007AD3EA6|nr:PREDICTED: uncharacterized protein LOC107570672 [Sinocyclocheilus grahami]